MPTPAYEELPCKATEIEEAFIGSLLVNPDLDPQAWTEVAPEDFFVVRNGWIVAAAQALLQRGEGVDYTLICQELKRGGQLAEVDYDGYFLHLMTYAPSVPYLAAYKLMLRRASYRRKAQKMAEDIINTIRLPDVTEDDIQRRVEVMTRRLGQALPDQGSDYLHGDEAHAIYQQIIQQRLASDLPQTFPLFHEGFEDIVPAIKPGKLVVISGFSGYGKTIFMEEWAEWLAMLGHRVLYITTELTVEDHLDRRYVRHTGLPYHTVIDPDEAAQAELDGAKSRLDPWQHNLDFWEVNERGHELVLGQMQRAYEHGRRVFFVDYFWEILEDDEHQTIDDAVKALHTFAKRTRTLVVVGSQLSETEHGPRTYGTRRLEHKPALHIRIERSEKLKVSETYQIDGRLIDGEAGQPDPFKRFTIVKNTYGPANVEVRLFLDGPRFSFVGESHVGIGGGSLGGYALPQPKPLLLGNETETGEPPDLVYRGDTDE